jgi:hypothetical protein
MTSPRNPNGLLPAISWAAVSTAEQAEDDKASIPTQLETNRINAAREGYYIVDEIIVAGQSRYHDTIAECAVAMRAEGVDAFDRIQQHWRARDAKALFCRDADRFSRTLSMGAEFVAKTYRAGMMIYSEADGWRRSERQALDWIASAGLRAQSNVMFLVDARKKATPGLAKKGLYVTGKPPRTHKLIRDERGRRLGVVIDEHMRNVMYDAARLVMEGVEYPYIEDELLARYGHCQPDGKPYTRLTFYTLLMNPFTYGHIAAGRGKKRGIGRYPKRGMWIFEPGHETPDDVEMIYDVHAPLFDPETQRALIAEMVRRFGRRQPRPRKEMWGTRLFVCKRCRSTMEFSNSPQKYTRADGVRVVYQTKSYFKCGTVRHTRPDYPSCDNRKYLREADAKAAVTEWLELRLSQVGARPLDIEPSEQRADFERAEAEVQRLERLVNRLVLQRAEAPDGTDGVYAAQIEANGRALKLAAERLNALRAAHIQAEHAAAAEKQAADGIRDMGIDKFWAMPAALINTHLRLLLGDVRFSVDGGKVVGMIAAPDKYHYRTRKD